MSPTAKEIIEDRLRRLHEYLSDIHEYCRIDPAIVYGILLRNLEEMRNFSRVVSEKFAEH